MTRRPACDIEGTNLQHCGANVTGAWLARKRVLAPFRLPAGLGRVSGLRGPSCKVSVHLRVDADVLAWFSAEGRDHLTRIDAVLRACMKAHKRKVR
jgi:hypothetical protein